MKKQNIVNISMSHEKQCRVNHWRKVTFQPEHFMLRVNYKYENTEILL